MVTKEVIRLKTCKNDLCKTYSTDRKKLLQTETGIVYGSEVIDVFNGYDENGNPISRYSYMETEEYDVDSEQIN